MKKIGKYLLIIFVTLLFTINSVNAKDYLKELFQTGEKIKINEELDGTAFLAGNKVTINESIKGIGFILGEEVEINDDQEYLFVAGYDTLLKTNIKNDLFIYSEDIKIKETNINRDAYIAGTNINIEGNINRNAYIYGTNVNIKGTIKGNIYINSTEIKIDKDAKILGTLKYNENANIVGLTENIKTKTYKTTEKISLTDYITSFITSYIHLTLLGLVLVYLFTKTLKTITSQTKDKKQIISLLGKGFLILIGVPIISLTLIMTNLFMPIGIIALILYGILIYISEIIVAYILAKYLDKKYIKKKLNDYLIIILGIFIIKIISIIPIIGGLLYFLILLLGLGIVGNMIIETKK